MAISFDELIADAPSAPGSATQPTGGTLQPSQTVPPDADDQVELALFRRATGGVTWIEALDRNGLPVKLERDLPPDPKAAQAWLQARRPATWGQGAGQAPPVVVIVRDAAQLRAQLAMSSQVSVIEHEKNPASIEPEK